jgi:hypothetical protein
MKNKKILACFLLLLYLPLVYADVDTDNDGIIDSKDNCIEVYNLDQRDTNQDGFGNICDSDLDNDGYVTSKDGDIIKSLYGSTPESSNWNPDADLNGDNIIDMTDVIIWTDMYGENPGPSYGSNKDKDGWIDEKDNCPDVYNPDQLDTDNNGIGDVCEKTVEASVTNETITTNPIFVPTGSAYFTGFPEKVEVFVGDTITVNGNFESTLNYNLYDITFSIETEGLNEEWYTVSPEIEFMLEKGKKINVSISFNIPKDAEIYTYSVKIKASAGSKIGLQTFSKTFKLMLQEKLGPLTTSSTSTTTTTIPEEERIKFPFDGFYSFIKANPWITPVIIVIVLIIIAFYVIKPRYKGRYVYGKGWVKGIKTFKFFSTSSIKILLTKW